MSCADLSHEYGIVGYKECSGNGVCLNGQCVCDYGWTGYSDMELIEGFDCDINIAAVRVWTLINIIICSLSSIIIAYCCVRENIFSSKHKGSPKFTVFVAYLVYNILCVIQCIERIVNPEKNVIGGDIFQNVFLSIVCSCCTIATSSFIIILINFLKGYSRFFDEKCRDMINDNTRIFFLMPYLSTPFIFVGLLLSSMTAYFLPGYSDQMNIMAVVTFVLVYIYCAGSSIMLLHFFTHEMYKYLQSMKGMYKSVKQHESGRAVTINLPGSDPMLSPPGSSKIKPYLSLTNDVQRIHDRALLAYRLGLPTLILLNLPMFFLFISWKIIRRKVVYLWLFDMIGVALVSTVFVIALSTRLFKKKVGIVVVQPAKLTRSLKNSTKSPISKWKPAFNDPNFSTANVVV